MKTKRALRRQVSDLSREAMLLKVDEQIASSQLAFSKRAIKALLQDLEAEENKPLRKVVLERMWRHDNDLNESPKGWYGDVYSLHYGWSWFKWGVGFDIERMEYPFSTYVSAYFGPFYIIGIRNDKEQGS